MIQIFADDVTNASRSAMLFIKSIKKECDLKGVKCVISEMIDITSPFIIAEPNSLVDVQKESMRSMCTNIENHYSVEDVVMEILKIDATDKKIVVFGGSGKVSSELCNRIEGELELSLVKNISSKTPLYEVMNCVKTSDVIVSAITFEKQLIIDLYGKSCVIDISNSLSHSDFKCKKYYGYRDIGKTFVKKMVEIAESLNGL